MTGRQNVSFPYKKPALHQQSLKHLLRSFLDYFCCSSGVLKWFEKRMRFGLTILMYHRVLPLEKCVDYPLESLVIPDKVFSKQVKWLADHCTVLPVSEAIASLATAKLYEKPLVSITFDDGYADNFEIAAPILEEKGLYATFFVTTGFIKESKPLWYDRAANAWRFLSRPARKNLIDQIDGVAVLRKQNEKQSPSMQDWMAALKYSKPSVRMHLVDKAEAVARRTIDLDLYRPMPYGQLVELHKRGHEIASHTVTHPIMPQIQDDELRKELIISAGWLQELTGDKIIGFCYPNGDFDSRVESAVLDAGYGYACTMESGMNYPEDRETRLARLAITMQRTVFSDGSPDLLGFRAELCRLRELWR